MYIEVSVFDLKRLSNINIIDIRSIEKYNDNHIPGSINIPKLLIVKDYYKYLDKKTLLIVTHREPIQAICSRHYEFENNIMKEI